MPRQATKSELREEKDQKPAVRQSDALDPEVEVIDQDHDTLTALADSNDDDPLQEPARASSPAPRKRRGSGIITLVILALVGMAVGFAVVMLL